MATSRITNGLENVWINKNPGSKEVLQIEVISHLDLFQHKGSNKTQVLSFEFCKIFFILL